jgi:Skp family chaperone for outer membrane proteins
MNVNLSRKTKTFCKMVTILAAIVFLSFLFANIAIAQRIGQVNLTKITASHSNTEKIEKLRQELRTELQNRQEKLNQEGKGLEETELMKLEEKFNAEWEPIKQKMLTQLQALQAERDSDIVQAVKAVGEKGNYEVIINSEVPVFTGNNMIEYPIILYGGDNITQDVIAELENITAP